MSHKHNSKVHEQQPKWAAIDLAALPDRAFADSKRRKYPHHWVEGGTARDADGRWANGTMYLHTEGLAAAWAAVHGARGLEKATEGLIAHLNSARSAIGAGTDRAAEEAALATVSEHDFAKFYRPDAQHAETAPEDKEPEDEDEEDETVQAPEQKTSDVKTVKAGKTKQTEGRIDMNLLDQLKKVFGSADKAIELLKAKPEAADLGDFQVEILAELEQVRGELKTATEQLQAKTEQLKATERDLAEAKKAPAVVTIAGDPPKPEEKGARTNGGTEADWKAEYEKSADLQAEFATVDLYVHYKKNQDRIDARCAEE